MPKGLPLEYIILLCELFLRGKLVALKIDPVWGKQASYLVLLIPYTTQTVTFLTRFF